MFGETVLTRGHSICFVEKKEKVVNVCLKYHQNPALFCSSASQSIEKHKKNRLYVKLHNSGPKMPRMDGQK